MINVHEEKENLHRVVRTPHIKGTQSTKKRKGLSARKGVNLNDENSVPLKLQGAPSATKFPLSSKKRPLSSRKPPLSNNKSVIRSRRALGDISNQRANQDEQNSPDDNKQRKLSFSQTPTRATRLTFSNHAPYNSTLLNFGTDTKESNSMDSGDEDDELNMEAPAGSMDMPSNDEAFEDRVQKFRVELHAQIDADNASDAKLFLSDTDENAEEQASSGDELNSFEFGAPIPNVEFEVDDGMLNY